MVTIKGKNLKTATKVLFGSAKGLKLTVKSDRKLKVTAPPHAEGTVDVKVKTKGGKSGKASAARFTFVAPTPPPTPPPPPPPPPSPPTVTGVSPGSGPISGGTPVTVTGTNLTGATSVTFGGTAATGLTPGSSTSLTVTSPAHAAGQVDVRVTTSAGTSAVVAADQFVYQPPSMTPTVTEVSPPSGPDTGNARHRHGHQPHRRDLGHLRWHARDEPHPAFADRARGDQSRARRRGWCTWS